MNRTHLCATLALAAGLLAAALPATAQTTNATFGLDEEGFTGNVFRDTTLGNAAPAMHIQLETFGLSLRTTTNSPFIGNYGATPSVSFSMDVLTTSIAYLGTEVSRSLVLELRDYDNPENGLPYTSVYTSLGTISSAASGWQHLSVTIADTRATALPTGWGGYGDEDANGAPRLPADRTFASVLQGVDEFVVSTFVPGYFYGFTDFDVAIDNVSVNHISAVPEPETLAMMALGLTGIVLRKRRSATVSRSRV